MRGNQEWVLEALPGTFPPALWTPPQGGGRARPMEWGAHSLWAQILTGGTKNSVIKVNILMQYFRKSTLFSIDVLFVIGIFAFWVFKKNIALNIILWSFMVPSLILWQSECPSHLPPPSSEPAPCHPMGALSAPTAFQRMMYTFLMLPLD